eukprot:1105149-Pleurochrysis_carterae.AAC.1
MRRSKGDGGGPSAREQQLRSPLRTDAVPWGGVRRCGGALVRQRGSGRRCWSRRAGAGGRAPAA